MEQMVLFILFLSDITCFCLNPLDRYFGWLKCWNRHPGSNPICSMMLEYSLTFTPNISQCCWSIFQTWSGQVACYCFLDLLHGRWYWCFGFPLASPPQMGNLNLLGISGNRSYFSGEIRIWWWGYIYIYIHAYIHTYITLYIYIHV